MKHPNIVIVTHTFFYGASEALKDYLIAARTRALLYIGHPLRKEKPFYYEEFYISGRKSYARKKSRELAGTFASYLLDMMRTFSVVWRHRERNIVYIGINPLNACVGILLRILGRVDRVIFYAIDFVPTRSRVYGINTLYHVIEWIAVRFSNQCWNVSPRIAEGRRSFLGIRENPSRDRVVPIGLWKKDIVKQARRACRNRLIFVGHLLEKQGVQKVIQALPKILRNIPDTTLMIVGGGEYEGELRKLARALSLQEHIKFLGWESNQDLIRKYIRESDVAVATYDPSGARTTNFSYYADPTKIKTYLSCGIPVIMTDVSYNAKTLENRNVAKVVPYDASAIASAITSWLRNPKTLYGQKKKAIAEARSYLWDEIFKEALKYI